MKLYDDFYEIFEKAILELIYPNTILSLSGGLDTRVIAGILSENNVEIPAISFGTKIENIIASKVALTLGLEHYVSSRKKLLSHEVFDILEQKGFKYILSGILFDEINGGWSGFKARNYEQFYNFQKIGLEKRFNGFKKYYKNREYPVWTIPILNSKVITHLETMPYCMRTGKKIQRWILKNKFPRLWHIPYYDSLLPNFFPYIIHGLATFLHNKHDIYLAIRRRIEDYQHYLL